MERALTTPLITQRPGLVHIRERLARLEQPVQLFTSLTAAAGFVQGNDHVVTDVRDMRRFYRRLLQ